ncbi:MAG TPA: hypothetical protein VK774_08075, partial [Solirubrobacteraceae bacterium]|nr:hypothetical protein [Solirubrobacteraceae bacterium]
MAAAVQSGTPDSFVRSARWRMRLLAALLLVACAALAAPTAQAAVTPEQDPFYKYEGKTKLKQLAPGTVLKTRTVSFHTAEIPTPIT